MVVMVRFSQIGADLRSAGARHEAAPASLALADDHLPGNHLYHGPQVNAQVPPL
jgi:hypothetical protein